MESFLLTIIPHLQHFQEEKEKILHHEIKRIEKENVHLQVTGGDD